MSSANQEQLKAIEHHGGVLLKAGAGSGKTFVLKEHMIYLTKVWIEEFINNQNSLDFETYLKQKYIKIVMMTFTKKAAGEISIRLFNEFALQAEQADLETKKYWEKACEVLDYLTVTTIHGFCFKLIKQGFFTDIDLDNEIINEAEYGETIREIFDLWLESELKRNQDHDFIDLVIKDREHILDSIKAIFADPSLRQRWNSFSVNSVSEKEINSSIQDLVEINKLNAFLEDEINLLAFDEFEEKTWYEFLKEFEKEKRKIETLDDFVALYSFFEKRDFKMPVTPRAKGVDERLKSYYGSIKSLKDYMKGQGLDIYMFSKNKGSLVKNWLEKFYEIIQFVENKYSTSAGITFSDLEYVVAKGLEKESVAKAISEAYDYLIIDEFQDTSFIQFEIISKILRRDYRKLFCVGDIKQAIYGFRGGELGVFLNCETLVPKVLSLKNNYRSDKDIIHFNNNIFDFLFRKGLKFQGDDIKPVEVEYQEAPIKQRDSGKVYQGDVNIEFLEKLDMSSLSSSEIDYIEALGLYENIKRLLEEDAKQIAVLYKKLKPSLLLIGLLIEKEVSFTAQIKVPLGEDPILGLFKSLLEYEFNTNESKADYLKLILQAYLGLIDSELRPDLEKAIENFYQNQAYFGVYRSFYQFINELGVANSNYKNNLSYINSLCQLASDEKENILSLLDEAASNSYSLDFQYGKNPSQIILMTAHASKGLQFPHVLLGGIYTNDKSFPFTSLLGKFPMSFKWGETITSKQKYRTPQYLVESEVAKHKDFSESKRLFYVACTRAENSIGWININFGKIKKRLQSGSWNNGLQTWFSEKFKNNNELIEKIKDNSVEINIEESFSTRFLENSSNKKPLFHIDDLGIVKKEEVAKSLILPELSVTRLASLAQCPRKFYLQNICKLSQEDMNILQDETARLEYDEESELSAKSFSSSAQRGSLIHEEIDRLIKSEFKDEVTLSGRDKTGVDWVVDNLKKYQDNFEFISEKNIKFEFFNYMISGIPDLILFSEEGDHSSEIWDYKTGKSSESKQKPYRFQLMSYAYALYNHYGYSKEKQIKLVLCYLDEKKLVEESVSYDAVDKYLSDFWELINSPEKINTESCDLCAFNLICRK